MDNQGSLRTEGKTGKSQLVIAFILGLIVGVLVAPTFFGDNGVIGEGLLNNNGDAEGDEIISTLGKNTVTVVDQLAGDRVILKSVSLDASGWVVVHEDLAGEPGNALGAQRFDSGIHENGYIDLLRNTEINKLYYIILYSDNGDGEFDIKTDTPLSVGEESVSTIFHTVTIDRKNN